MSEVDQDLRVAVRAAVQQAPFDKVAKIWEIFQKQFGDRGRRALCLEDRYYLLCVEMARVDALHPWLYARCREVEANPDGYIDLWAREHYKSTIITFAGSIQEILRDPNITIAIFSHTSPIAKKFMRQIKEELERNVRLQSLFPDILYSYPERDSPRWSIETGIVVKRTSNAKEGTLEAWGLVDGQPVSAHYLLRIYDDVVTDKSVTTPEQVSKTTNSWALSDNLGARGENGLMRDWHVGTRYCTVASTRITMGDWTQKAIADVRVGDVVVGWEPRDGRRSLVPATVKAAGCHRAQPVKAHTFDDGATVTCTADHRWWRGPHGGGAEYRPIGTGLEDARTVRRLLVPTRSLPIEQSLYAAMETSELTLVSCVDAGVADVYWIETETGNYIAEGLCSKNSFADTYQFILDKKLRKARLYPATDDGTFSGKPVFLNAQAWAEKLKLPAPIVAAQQLQNPAAGNEAMFKKEWLKFADVRPGTLNVYIMCDPASSHKKGSDYTAIVVIGIDAGNNMYLLDGYRHKMRLSERWMRLRDLRRKWLKEPGVQMVKVGYERFGLNDAMEHFEQQMEREKDSFEIIELAWPNEGPGSKIDRVQRLEPAFKFGKFFLAARTGYQPKDENGEPVGDFVDAESPAQKRMRESGQAHRIFTPIKRVDEEGNLYRLNKVLLDEYLFFPFSATKDFIDACSRIYDMEPRPPVIVDQSSLEPEIHSDGA